MSARIDMTGKRFGRYTVIKYVESKNHDTYWESICDCGTVKVVSGRALRSGSTRSCGCLFSDMLKERSANSDKGTRIYREWTSMRNRCYCSSNTSYPRYGGRGITVCDEWKDYKAFKLWAISNGYTDELTLDRIDPNGIYEPSNCRWITAQDQCINRRNTVYVEYNGEVKPLLTFCNELNLDYQRMWNRIVKYKWDVNRAFETPIRSKNVCDNWSCFDWK